MSESADGGTPTFLKRVPSSGQLLARRQESPAPGTDLHKDGQQTDPFSVRL
jgi:hypothetical protein